MVIKHSTTHAPNDVVTSADWNKNLVGTLNHETELTNVTSDQHHPQSHNAASHSDITATGTAIDGAVGASHAAGSDNQVAGDFAHNSLSGLNDGTNYEHLSAAQVGALHGVNDANTSSATSAQGALADSALQSETDPIFTAWDKDYNDLTNTPTTITAGQASAITTNTTKVSYTDAVDVGLNTGARHSQNTDTALGAQSENLDMNTHKIVGVIDPETNQEAATKKYVDDSVAGAGGGDMLKTVYDTDEDGIVDKAESVDDGVNSATAANIEDAVTKRHANTLDHAQNTDTDLDATFEATFVKKVNNVNVLADITSSGANIEDAVTKRHAKNTDTALGAVSANINMNTHKLTSLSAPSTAGDSIRATAKITEALLGSATDLKHSQNTDTALGAQSENLDMNTHKIVGVIDPETNQEAATKKYVDDNVGFVWG